MFHITQCVNGSGGACRKTRSCSAMAKLWVPAGAPDQLSSGDTFSASPSPVFSSGKSEQTSRLSGPHPAGLVAKALELSTKLPVPASGSAPAPPAPAAPAAPAAPPEPAVPAVPAAPAVPLEPAAPLAPAVPAFPPLEPPAPAEG